MKSQPETRVVDFSIEVSVKPFKYTRDLLCLPPTWPVHRVLELAPTYWRETLQDREAQQILAADVFRRFSTVQSTAPEHLAKNYTARQPLSAPGKTERLRCRS